MAMRKKNTLCYNKRAVCQLHKNSKGRTFKMGLNDNNSLSHTKWNCKYHIVFAPKYRRRVFYKAKRVTMGRSQRQLREWKGVKIIEAEVCPDHTYAGRESAEASGGKFHGMPERKEQHNAIRTVWRSEVQIPKQRGLVEGGTV